MDGSQVPKQEPNANTIYSIFPADYRRPDVQAMVDMSHNHYRELRYGVRSPLSRARKTFDALLCRYLPVLDWTSSYARVQFGNERLSVVEKKEKKQDNFITEIMLAVAISIALAFLVGLKKLCIWAVDLAPLALMAKLEH